MIEETVIYQQALQNTMDFALVDFPSGIPAREVIVQFCPGCREDRTQDRIIGSDCALCGSKLVRITRAAESVTRDDVHMSMGFFEGLFDIIGGAGMAAELMAVIRGNASVQPISNDFLKTIGRVSIDAHGGLLLDVTLKIGPYKAMLIPSSFAPLPRINETISAPLAKGDPECGDGDFLNKHDIEGAIVLLKRGKVTFLEKALRAQASGAAAVVVAQTYDTWPFVMTETDVAAAASLNIPLLMIGKTDSKMIDGMIQNCRTGKRIAADICTENIDPLCSICHESFVELDVVLKLPCRHMYHEGCVVSWLETHNTCPLCRHDMPIQEKKVAAAAPGLGTDASDNAARQPYFM